MIDDPYKVLGIAKTASPEEIKRAYRKKAKEYHPDLHPDDPAAAQKMNEVNEAYDMLQNPEKYKASPNRSSTGSRGTGGSSYRNAGTGGSAGYQGAGGWSSDFGGFDFEDLFGFGFSDAQYTAVPHAEPGDHPELVRAINAFNAGRYRDAAYVLSQITSRYRDDRWYYVSAETYCRCGDSERAQDLIMRAIQLAPDNKTYRMLLRQYRSQESMRTEYSYRRSSQSPLQMMGKVVIGTAALQFIFMLMHALFYGMMLPY